MATYMPIFGTRYVHDIILFHLFDWVYSYPPVISIQLIQDKIIKIDPKTGYIVEEINMSSLYPINKRTKTADCLNGIAYDKTKGLFYVTGKLWPKLFAVLFKRTITSRVSSV